MLFLSSLFQWMTAAASPWSIPLIFTIWHIERSSNARRWLCSRLGRPVAPGWRNSALPDLFFPYILEKHLYVIRCISHSILKQNQPEADTKWLLARTFLKTSALQLSQALCPVKPDFNEEGKEEEVKSPVALLLKNWMVALGLVQPGFEHRC